MHLVQNLQIHEAKLQGEIDKSTAVVGYFNTALSIIDETSR